MTSLINAIYKEAPDVSDYRILQLPAWYEQGEEEKNVEDDLKKYELFENDAKGLYQLDKELGSRA